MVVRTTLRTHEPPPQAERVLLIWARDNCTSGRYEPERESPHRRMGHRRSNLPANLSGTSYRSRPGRSGKQAHASASPKVKAAKAVKLSGAMTEGEFHYSTTRELPCPLIENAPRASGMRAAGPLTRRKRAYITRRRGLS